MLAVLQLLLAIFAIFSALEFPEHLRLLVPLGCLIVMLVISRIDKQSAEKSEERKKRLKARMEEMLEKEESSTKEQDFFTIDSLLWPKNEFMLTEAVHFIFKDLKFRVSTGVHYHSVDRIVRIPDSEMAFGLEILMSEKELDKNHPKIERALQFQSEKKESEKALIIACTYIRLQLSDRGHVSHISRELADLLSRNRVSVITAHHLYQLWQKAKAGELDIFKVFQQIYAHPGGVFLSKKMENSLSLSFDLPGQSSLSD
jgi:ATP-dependent exoDNAse (exonuclease V) alpha subunit